MKILRSIAAIVVGLIVAMVTIMIIEGVSHAIDPPPEGFQISDREAAKKLLDSKPIGMLLMLPLAWESGAFLGGLLAALIVTPVGGVSMSASSKDSCVPWLATVKV